MKKILALFFLMSPSIVQAATFTVNTTNDTVDVTIGNGSCADAAGQCSLRAAIQEANSAAGNDQISLPTGTYLLTIIPTTNEHSAAKGDLDVNQSGAKLTLIGAGAGQSVVDANSVDRVFDIRSGSSAELQGITVKRGVVKESGIVLVGAGIRNAGTLTLVNVSLEGNGIGQPGLSGGALANQGTLSIVGSTLNGNNADSGAAISQDGTSLLVVNSTISGNTATVKGGGLDYVSGAVNLNNVTLFGNSAGTGQGGGVNTGATTNVHLKNTVIAGNNATTGKDCNGQLSSDGFNWIQVQTGCNVTGVASGDPKLGALANNGGPTQTHAPASDSPLLDAGDTAGCKDASAIVLATDQRGFTRPVKALATSTQAICDIGAYELNPCGNGVKEADLGEECDDGNQIDNDACSNACKNQDVDGDGFIAQTAGGNDCNDTDANIHPNATELCNDKDDNCDGKSDETFTDKGTSCAVGTGACSGTGHLICTADGSKTACDTSAKNPGTETCNGIDDDCNGSVDDGLGQTTCGVGTCQVTVDNCKDGKAQACASDESKKTTEICGNGVDEDCDASDQVCPVSVVPPATTGGTTTAATPTTPTNTDTPATPSNPNTAPTTETVSTSGGGGGCSLLPH